MKHVTLKQPSTIRGTLRRILKQRELIIDSAIDIMRAKQLIFTASGNSRYVALIGRYLLSKLAGQLGEVIMSSELHYFADSIDRNTLLVTVSQESEEGDIITGIMKARDNGARVLSLVGMGCSPLINISDKVILTGKSIISQLVIFYLLAFAMINKIDDASEKIKDISFLIGRSLDEENIKRIAKKLKGKSSIYYLARGINFAIASEGSLKLKQVAHIHAEGMPAGELKHGTLSLIEKGTPVIAICPNDYTYHEMILNISETKARGAFVIGVSDKHNELFDEWIRIPFVGEIFYPLVTITPLHLLTYYIAKKGV